MSDGTKAFFQRWFVTTLGVLIAAGIVDGIRADGALPLVTASLLLGILNAFLRPILMIVALPLVVVTFGLFIFVINALLLYLVGTLVEGAGFYVADFWSALKGAIVISIVTVVLNMMIGTKKSEAPAPVDRRPPPPNTGSGPVIDV